MNTINGVHTKPGRTQTDQEYCLSIETLCEIYRLVITQHQLAQTSDIVLMSYSL